jgi:hypothetical protein
MVIFCEYLKTAFILVNIYHYREKVESQMLKLGPVLALKPPKTDNKRQKWTTKIEDFKG